MSDAEQAPTTPTTTGVLDRRTVFRGLAVGGVALPLLAACGGGTSSSSGEASASDSSDPGGSGASGASGGGGTVATSDVPEGGGTVLTDQKVVVTQPAKGEFKAFTAVCTHQSCLVTKVEDGQIVCPCHGSHYSIKDGSVTSGPAPSPLSAKKVTVEGDQISVS